MDFINNLSPLLSGFLGLLVGAIIMRLLNNHDKTTITLLSSNLAVSEEKLRHSQNKEIEFMREKW